MSRRAPVETRPSRTTRYQEESRRRQWIALAALAGIVLSGGVAFILVRDQPPASSPPAPAQPQQEIPTLLLSVRGAKQPLLAVVGGGEDPVALPIPPALTLEAPALGQVGLSAIAELPGDSMRIAISNTLGMWVDDYAVTDLGRLAAIVDRVGGLRVNLPSSVTLGAVVLGPGEVTATGSQVRGLLTSGGDELLRWEVVLTGLLASPPTLGQSDLLEVDDLAAVQQILDAGRGADLESFPTHVVAATARVPSYTDLDLLIRETYDAPTPIVRVVVENQSGAPAVSEDIARILVPLGYRVVLSGNAPGGFTNATTDVIAIGSQNVDAAERAREALGVGSVVLSGVPSGIADITIAVGRDFKS